MLLYNVGIGACLQNTFQFVHIENLYLLKINVFIMTFINVSSLPITTVEDLIPTSGYLVMVFATFDTNMSTKSATSIGDNFS